jgi:hypothetical protein
MGLAGGSRSLAGGGWPGFNPQHFVVMGLMPIMRANELDICISDQAALIKAAQRLKCPFA